MSEARVAGPTVRLHVLAASHGLLVVLLSLLVFVALPSRYAPVDVPAGGLIALSGAAAVSLWTKRPWGIALARAASIAYLVAGALCVALLAMSATYLASLYGPVGSGGALLMLGLAALIVPYMIFLPAWQLMAARPR